MTAADVPGAIVSEMTVPDIDHLTKMLHGDPEVVVESSSGIDGTPDLAIRSRARGVTLLRRTVDGEEEIVGWGPEPRIYRFPGPTLSGRGQPVTDGIMHLWSRVVTVFPAAKPRNGHVKDTR